MASAAPIVLALFGCGPKGADAPYTTPFDQLSKAEKVAELKQLNTRCRLTAGTISMNEAGEIRVQPRADERYEAVDCGIDGLKKLNVTSMGFVGNEAYREVGNATTH